MAAARAGSLGGSNGASAPASPGAGTRTASIFACVTTLSNTLMGVSVVGVAGGFARAGCAVSPRRTENEHGQTHAHKSVVVSRTYVRCVYASALPLPWRTAASRRCRASFGTLVMPSRSPTADVSDSNRCRLCCGTTIYSTSLSQETLPFHRLRLVHTLFAGPSGVAHG